MSLTIVRATVLYPVGMSGEAVIDAPGLNGDDGKPLVTITPRDEVQTKQLQAGRRPLVIGKIRQRVNGGYNFYKPELVFGTGGVVVMYGNLGRRCEDPSYRFLAVDPPESQSGRWHAVCYPGKLSVPEEQQATLGTEETATLNELPVGTRVLVVAHPGLASAMMDTSLTSAGHGAPIIVYRAASVVPSV